MPAVNVESGGVMMRADYFSHPIFSATEFRIPTPAMNELQEALQKLVWTGATGAALLGFSRAGKTTALTLLTDKIESRRGNRVPVFLYSAHKRDGHTIRALYENIFSQLGFEYRRGQRTDTLASNLLMHLAEAARANDVEQVVMVVDETQRLAIPQIDLFSELYDRLRREYAIALICLFVGNREQMGRLLEDVQEGENEHIEGRFFRQIFSFTGLHSVEDVRFCLQQYDKLRFPKRGPTYTGYFLPDAYKDGFRLASLAESMWAEYRECKSEWGLKDQDWSMESFVRAVNTLLTDYLPQYGVAEYSADGMFRPCIEVSGLRPGLASSEDVK